MKKLVQTTEVEVPKCVSLKKQPKKKYYYFFISSGMLCLLIISSLIQLSLANGLTTQGITLGKMQEQIKATRQENMLLAEQVYTLSSYTHIASQAASLGFVEAKSAIFLHADSRPLAIKP